MGNAVGSEAEQISRAGMKAAKEELEYLKTVRRRELAEEIKEARSHGDLSENSEYDEAKNTQGLVENRIHELELLVKHAHVIDAAEVNGETVMVGTHVCLKPEDGAAEEQYDIVSSAEADPFHGRISDVSPVGASLLGKSVHDTVHVQLPTGRTADYEILEIARSVA